MFLSASLRFPIAYHSDNVAGRNRKGKKSAMYPDLPSTSLPVGHSSDIPGTWPFFELPSNDANNVEVAKSQDITLVFWLESDKNSRLITQPELYSLLCDLTLTKQHSVSLVSHLRQWILLNKDTRTTEFMKRSADLQQFFTLETDLNYFNDIGGFFIALDLPEKANNRRLFIDTSLYSIKTVPLHTGHNIPLVPAYSIIVRDM